MSVTAVILISMNQSLVEGGKKKVNGITIKGLLRDIPGCLGAAGPVDYQWCGAGQKWVAERLDTAHSCRPVLVAESTLMVPQISLFNDVDVHGAREYSNSRFRSLPKLQPWQRVR